MKTKKVLVALVLVVSALGTIGVIFANNGNGNGGGTANNSGNKVKIYHKHGNGTFSLMHIPPQAVQGHANHGDLWYQTGCPLTGDQFACWQ